MRVDFSVPEQQIRLIEIGMPVTASTEVGDTDAHRPDLGDRAADRPEQPARHRPRRGRQPRRAASTPASSCGCASSCPRRTNVIALPQTVLSSTLYGDSVFVVRTEGEGDAAEADGRAGLRQGRPALARPGRDRRGAAGRRRGGHRRPEPADRRRAASSSTTRSTRRRRAAAAATRARRDALLRALHPPAGALDRARRLHPAARLPGHLQPAGPAVSGGRGDGGHDHHRLSRRPARPDPGLHHRADRRARSRRPRTSTTSPRSRRPRRAWSACT